MNLPKIDIPTFELIQPSTNKPLKYRPFLVKEEKILLIAKESGDANDVYNAIKQIINNCVITEGFDVNTVPIYDMEYIFIQLRSKSVNNIVKFQVEDSDDGITYDLELDLDEVQVKMPEGLSNKIMVNDQIGLVLNYPTSNVTEALANSDSLTEAIYQLILNCVDYVFDEEDVYPWKEYTNEQKEEFLDHLSTSTFAKIQEFFEYTPKIEHIVMYKNSEGKDKKVVFRDLNDFFTLG